MAETTRGVVKVETGAGLDAEKMLTPDYAKEDTRSGVPCDEGMLAVVHTIARGGIGERVGAPAKVRSLFHEHDRDTAGGEMHGGCEPAEPAAGDQDGFTGDRRRHSSRPPTHEYLMP
jgi:hypothetical protein